MKLKKYDLYRVLHDCNVLRSAKKKAMEETEVLIETSMGDMKVKLYNDTPKHRDNFIKLAGQGRTTIFLFHRVVRGFMVQTGDPALKPGE